MIKIITTCLLLSLSMPTFAKEFAGINFENTVNIQGQSLQINGIGARSKFFIKVMLPHFTLKIKPLMPMQC